MDLNSKQLPAATFNGPLEAGIRAVAILGCAYPKRYDLQRLVAFDFLLVHTGEIHGWPASLHPPTPHRAAELLIRRKLVEDGLLLMMTRDLTERYVSPNGFQFGAGENAATFLASLSSNYLIELKERATWVVQAAGAMSDLDFRNAMRKVFSDWAEEFQDIEQSGGA